MSELLEMLGRIVIIGLACWFIWTRKHDWEEK
jgi:hypothetical protein